MAYQRSLAAVGWKLHKTLHEFEGFEGGEPISSASATLCSKSSPSSITSTPARRRCRVPRGRRYPVEMALTWG
jgi:hypothetical protein